MARQDNLFASSHLSAALRHQAQQIPYKVNQISRDQFLASTDEELLENLMSELEVEPLEVYEDRMEMDHAETQVDVSGHPGRDWGFPGRTGPLLVPGTEVKVSIPFTGDSELWSFQPSRYTSTVPYGHVERPRGDIPGRLVLTITKPHDAPPEEFKGMLDRLMPDIRFYLEGQRNDIEQFNKALPAQIQGAIASRRERLKKQEGLSDVLGIPMKQRQGSQSIEPINVKEKIIKPLPPPPKTGWKPEPGIEEKHYQNILMIIRHQGRTFETTPATYSVHDEEELRDMMLASLNIYLKGQGSGELFRKSGKTDICIKEGDRAAFVGECTIWYGEKELLAKIDQLLGYLTWRDVKAALVIFNKNVKGFTELLS